MTYSKDELDRSVLDYLRRVGGGVCLWPITKEVCTVSVDDDADFTRQCEDAVFSSLTRLRKAGLVEMREDTGAVDAGASSDESMLYSAVNILEAIARAASEPERGKKRL